MRVPWRRNVPRVDLGTYVAPDDLGRAVPFARIIEDGLMIARSSVRMSVKNQVIVAALRDGLSYDAPALIALARDAFRDLARENQTSADRIEREWSEAEERDGEAPYEDEAHQRRPHVQRLLAQALADTADDAVAIGEVVDAGRTAAWDEVARALTLRMDEDGPEDDPEYIAQREQRIRDLIDIDLTDLDITAAAERAMAEWRQDSPAGGSSESPD